MWSLFLQPASLLHLLALIALTKSTPLLNMVQVKALTTLLIATTVILPALAAPVNFQGSEDLVA